MSVVQSEESCDAVDDDQSDAVRLHFELQAADGVQQLIDAATFADKCVKCLTCRVLGCARPVGTSDQTTGVPWQAPLLLVEVSVSPDDQERFIEMMATNETEFSLLGVVTNGFLNVDEELFGHITDIKMVYNNVLHEILGA